MVCVIEGESITTAEARFAIVVSRYNKSITSKLLAGAVDTLSAARVPEDEIGRAH